MFLRWLTKPLLSFIGTNSELQGAIVKMALPTIYATDTKIEHPLKPFNILKEEDLQKKENYDSIGPIHYKDMFVVLDKFSDAWDNKLPWQCLKWCCAIKLEILNKME
jgi:hypothetical protein